MSPATPAVRYVFRVEHEDLRNPDLLAELRRARAARFADRYEWLALRRRRAQIAARRALEG
jgi:hypothetical protein